MVRSLTLAVALALGTITVPAHALGLGDIKSHSALNQPFNADIDLLSVAAGELDAVHVRLASSEAFERSGLERPFFLTMLKFKPVRLENGTAVIRVSSDFPIREPFLNFLVEVNWPRGRLVREYTVLLDPPTTLSRRAPVQVQAPQAPTQTSRPAPATAAPAPATSQPQFSGSEYGPIRQNETLWSIARSVRPRGVSMEQMMIALQRANPQAFIDNNINKLRRGSILRVPGTEEILEISRNEARNAYRDQQDQWLTARTEQMQQAAPAPASEPEAEPAATTGTPAEADAQLRIATSRPEGEGEAGAGEDRGDAALDDIRSQLMVARENAETSRIESSGLRSEVDDLQRRLEDMQRLLALKDEQLARLQSGVVDDAGEGAAPVAAEDAQDAVAETPATSSVFADEPLDPVEAAMREAQARFDASLPAASEPAADAQRDGPADGAAALGPDQALIAAADAVAESANARGLPQSAVAEAPAAPEAAAPSAPPVAEAPVEVSAPQPAEASGYEAPIQMPEDSDWLSEYLPYLLGAGGLVLVLVLLLIGRRQKAEDDAQTDVDDLSAAEPAMPEADAAGEESEELGGSVGDTSFLSEFSPSDINALRDDTGEVDPVSEADVYIAYGRYQQAEELLSQAMEKDPDRLALKHKLLEVYYATRNAESFTGLAQSMVDNGQDIADQQAWVRAKDMGRELDADNPLFARDENEPRELDALSLGGVAAAGVAAATAAADDDDIDLALDDNELDSLASDLLHDEDQAASGGMETEANLALELDDLIDDENDLDEDSVPVEGLESLELDLPDLDSEELNSVLQMGEESASKSNGEAATADADSMLESELSPDDLEAQLDELSDLSVLDADLSELSADIDDLSGAPASEEILDKPISLNDAFDAEADESLDTDDVDLALDTPLSEDIPRSNADVDEEAVDTKLDLARAYIEMGDLEGASSILEEVSQEGSESQMDEARRLLDDMD